MNDMFESIKKSFNEGYSYILNYSTASVELNYNKIVIYSDTIGLSVDIDKNTNGKLIDGHWVWNDGDYDWDLIAYEVKKFEA